MDIYVPLDYYDQEIRGSEVDLKQDYKDGMGMQSISAAEISIKI